MLLLNIRDLMGRSEEFGAEVRSDEVRKNIKNITKVLSSNRGVLAVQRCKEETQHRRKV